MIINTFYSSVSLQVEARDQGRPPQSTTTRVLLTVAGVRRSHRSPEVAPLPPVHLMETDPPGHLVAYLTATDPDNDTLWYSIAG